MSQWRIKNHPMMWFQPKLNQKITAAKKSCQIPLLTSKKRPRKSPMTKKLRNRQKKNLVAHGADHEIVRDQDLVKEVLAQKIQIKGSMTIAVEFHSVFAEFRSIDFSFSII